MVQVFDKKIHLKEYVCSPSGGFNCQNVKVNLYIYASGFCPAKCSFCPGFSSRTQINFDKLKTAISELHNKNLINRISITGGEPLSNLTSLNNILKTIDDVCKNTYHVSVNTNGINLAKLKTIEYFHTLKDVHISRHSSNDIENKNIFKLNTPTLSQIKEETFLNKNIFSLSCNLIKGHVDTAETLKKYLDAAIDANIYQVGFVSLMNKTDICKELFIDYEDITSKLFLKDGFMFDTMAKDKTSCKCENYTYTNDNGSIPFYLRRVIGGKLDCVKAFIFTHENELITNFGKDMVLL